jgi:HK97 family phage portal protein
MNLWQRLSTAYKAISYRPDLASRVHVYSEYAVGPQTTSKDTSDNYEQVYAAHIWVHKAVAKVSEALASLYVQVVDDEDSAIENHELETLLNRGNPSMSPVKMWERYAVDMLLHGETFFEIVDSGRARPTELWIRSPAEIMLQPDMSPDKVYYPQVAQYVWKSTLSPSTIIFPPESMIHDKFYNPLNQWRGLAPIAAVREGIVIDMFAQAWSKRFLMNSGRPDFAIIAPQGLTQSERDRIYAEFMHKHSGADNWHKPVILEEGMTDVKPFSFPPADMQWLEQRNTSRDEIGAIFGVPDEIMGYGKDTYENFQTALEVFWTLTVKPLAEHRDDNLTHYFTYVRPILKPGQRIATDFSTVGVLQEDIAPKIEMATKLKSLGYTANEINERLSLGMPDIEEPEPITVVDPQQMEPGKPKPPAQIEDKQEPAKALYLPLPVRQAVESEVRKSLEIRTRLQDSGTFDANRWRENALKALAGWLDEHIAARMVAAMESATDVTSLLDSAMEDAAGNDAFFLVTTEWANYP